MPTERALACLKHLADTEKIFHQALAYAAEEYANGGNRAAPIVDRHFTAGNGTRYDWAPLSARYTAAKARGVVNLGGGRGHLVLSGHERARVAAFEAKQAKRRKGMFDHIAHDQERKEYQAAQVASDREARNRMVSGMTGRRKGSKLDRGPKAVAPGAVAPATATPTMPMLVRTGRLRSAVTSRGHGIQLQGDVVRITFRGLPGYAQYLHEGTPKMPKRSPVELNDLDRQEVVDAARRFIDARVGSGGTVGVMHNTVGGVARTT